METTKASDTEWVGGTVPTRPSHEETEYPLFIPTEIWCRVFDCAHQMTVHPLPGILSVDTLDSGRCREQRSFALIASHVDQRWRDISTNMPSLWSWINFGTLSRYRCELKNYNMVQLFIKRSRNHPLDVRLASHSFGDDLTRYSDKDASGSCVRNKDSSAMDIIINHAYRWRSAHIILRPLIPRGDDFPFRLLFLSAPSLQRLWFYSSTRFLLQNSFLLGGAASLKCVRWDGVNPLSLPPPALPIVQCLDLIGQDGEILHLSILQHMPSLVTLAVCMNTFKPSDMKFEMPYLQTLKIAGSVSRTSSLQNFLYSMSAPVVDRLILFRISGRDMSEFISLLQRGRGAIIFPVLKTLEIISPDSELRNEIGMSYVSENLMSGLEMICHLVLVTAPTYDAIHVLSTAKLWPFLNTIQFGSNVSDRRLMALLKCRLEMGYPIKKLILPDMSPCPPRHDFDMLRKHVEVEIFDWLTLYDDRDIDFGGFDMNLVDTSERKPGACIIS